MKKDSTQPIATVLQNVVEQLSRVRESEIGKIISAWPALAGKEFAEHAQPVALRKKTLVINVDQSAWLYQANFQKSKLIQALQKKLGGKQKIQAIQFRIGKVR
ncbi:MAG: DUF721 domain-containing protein [Candidatus Omnitrophica bacterium]|nr:DUF721 domain-containing protein [Candidatus Omnitrophota bacterium]